MSAPFWVDTPVERLDRGQWEALCDGCGKCCLHKLEDEETGDIYLTNVACRLLDRRSGQCSDYARRRASVPDCIRLTPRNLHRMTWLPETCAYVRRAAGLALPEWHYLICGDREAVHRAGISVRGKTVSENDAGDLEQHIVQTDHPLVA